MKIALIVVGSIIAFFDVVAFAFAYFVLGAFHENTAQDAVAPLTQKLESIAGEKICEVGDAGYGPDNHEPWYYVYYRVPDSENARKVFFAEAASMGYPLLAEKKDIGSGPEVESFNSKPKDRSGLGLDIWRNARFSPVCDEFQDNQKLTTYGTGAIYEIEAPAVRR